MRISNLSKIALLLVVPALLVFTAGCDTLFGDDNDDDDDHNNGHPELEMLEVIDRGDGAQPVVATWTDDDGWDVDELELSEPLREGGDRASIGLRAYDHDGHELELEEDGEFFITYVLAEGAPEGILNMSFDDDTLYHGDHVHVYPQGEGTTQIVFLLWHVDHVEDDTDPITVRVLEAEME